MKKITNIFLSFGLCIISFISYAQQNLVPNPSFESYTLCPDNISGSGDDQVSRLLNWSSYRETPDCFNACTTNTDLSVPNNLVGYQKAHTGNGYCGIVTFQINTPYREAIGCNLFTPLTIGQKYYISFFSSFSGKPGFILASNNIGLRFSKNSFSYLNPTSVNNFSHLKLNSKNVDTLNWTKISGSFIADSAYQYITIGNFYDDISTDTLSFGPNANTSYYFIDDVCVTNDSIYNSLWTGLNFYNINDLKIDVYPNPFMNKVTIKAKNTLNNFKCKLFDIEGKLIAENKFQNNYCELKDLSEIPNGIYLLLITNDNEFIHKVIIKKQNHD